MCTLQYMNSKADTFETGSDRMSQIFCKTSCNLVMLTNTHDQSRSYSCLTKRGPYQLHSTPSHPHTLTPSHKHPEKGSLNAMAESPSLQNTFQPIAGLFSYTRVHPLTLTPSPSPHILTPSHSQLGHWHTKTTASLTAVLPHSAGSRLPALDSDWTYHSNAPETASLAAVSTSEYAPSHFHFLQ